MVTPSPLGNDWRLERVRAVKEALPEWVAHHRHDLEAMARERARQPYYGCYPWWRQAILGEDAETAERRARDHVQRYCDPCAHCTAGIKSDGRLCRNCDGTGHQRMPNPVLAKDV